MIRGKKNLGQKNGGALGFPPTLANTEHGRSKEHVRVISSIRPKLTQLKTFHLQLISFSRTELGLQVS